MNATTLLLWLFQNCSHEALLGLIALGVLCVVVSVFVFVFRTVSVSFYLVRFLLFYLPHGSSDLLISLLRCALWYGRSTRSPSQPLFDLPPLSNSPTARPNSSASARAALTREASLLRLPSESHRLSLPQSLALHPNQWSEIEAGSSAQLVPIADSSRSLAIGSPTVERHTSPRRSSRLRTRNLRVRSTCSCSS